MQSDGTPVIDICGNRTVEYIIGALTEVNRHNTERTVTLRAVGPRIAKGVAVAQIMCDKLGFSTKSSNTGTAKIQMAEKPPTLVPYLATTVHYESEKMASEYEPYHQRPGRGGYIPYPIYCLLFDALLSWNREIRVTFNKEGEKSRQLKITKASPGYSLRLISETRRVATRARLGGS